MMLTSQEVTERLQADQESFLVRRGRGVVRYDVSRLASNSPVEDEHVEQILASQGADWCFFGVMDGHAGGATSRRLRQDLVPYVVARLEQAHRGGAPASEQVDESIRRAFVELDDEICTKSLERVRAGAGAAGAAAVDPLRPALSGSCGLLAFFDSSSKLLKVACTGDSRAVLCRRGAGGAWGPIALSADQTGSCRAEVERLRREHPGEAATVVRNGRVLGNLEPTRAFGDAVYKWDAQTQQAVLPGRRVHPHLLTPPYVTAEPVVTTVSVRPELGDFLVLASDGLWERLSNDQVAKLAGKWMDQRGGPASGSEDRNAATHLVRSALGGANHEELSYLLSIPAGQSRSYRDDITVTVVFFGVSQYQDQDIVVNGEASSWRRLERTPRSRL